MKPIVRSPSWPEQLSRRDILRLGTVAGLSAATFGAAGGVSASPWEAHRAFGRARSCLLIFLAGGPSHLDTFDPKPEAPSKIRGEFGAIATSAPELRLCEHLPRLARRAHRFTIVRALGHTDSTHACASYRMLTGQPYPRDPWQCNHVSRDDHPHLGAIVAAAAHASESTAESAAPPFATVPGLLEAQGPARAGQHAGWLGCEFDPVVVGPGHGQSERDLDRYGPTRFGRSVLLGRRLVEAGSRLVQVNWDRRLEAGWDTHADGFSTLKDDLLPPTDRALSALLDDLDTSGLLDQTLVVVTGEFGRSPRVTCTGGRGHWPEAFSALLAGAGIAGGRAFGATDRHGALPADRPISPAALAATILFALGVRPPAPEARGEAPIVELWS